MRTRRPLGLGAGLETGPRIILNAAFALHDDGQLDDSGLTRLRLTLGCQSACAAGAARMPGLRLGQYFRP